MNHNAQYVDGIGNIQLAEGVIRLDLLMFTKIEGNNSTVEKVSGLAMSLPAFLRSFNQMTMVVNKMVDQGLLTRNQGAVEEPKASPPATP